MASVTDPSSPTVSPASAEATQLLVSVVIPCLNEAASIERCVELAWNVLDDNAIRGEVVVVDNGSTDGSAELAARAGARVVHEQRRGYGSAYLAGFEAAQGAYIVMADANLIYDTGVKDAHCGMRALRRDVLPRLDLQTTGMEFASEMVIRASKENLAIDQIPIEYHPREGESKLSSFRDGWRHLRFLLVHSPTHLFLVPDAFLAGLGILIMAIVLAHVSVFGRSWDVHTMIGGSLLTIVGTQILALGLCARAYGVYVLGERDAWFERVRPLVKLEHGLLAGTALILAGLAVGGGIIGSWVASGGGPLSKTRLARLAAPLVFVGSQ